MPSHLLPSLPKKVQRLSFKSPNCLFPHTPCLQVACFTTTFQQPEPPSPPSHQVACIPDLWHLFTAVASSVKQRNPCQECFASANRGTFFFRSLDLFLCFLFFSFSSSGLSSKSLFFFSWDAAWAIMHLRTPQATKILPWCKNKVLSSGSSKPAPYLQRKAVWLYSQADIQDSKVWTKLADATRMHACRSLPVPFCTWPSSTKQWSHPNAFNVMRKTAGMEKAVLWPYPPLPPAGSVEVIPQKEGGLETTASSSKRLRSNHCSSSSLPPPNNLAIYFRNPPPRRDSLWLTASLRFSGWTS